MVFILAGLAPCQASALRHLVAGGQTIKAQMMILYVLLPLGDMSGHKAPPPET